jgi:hypothetical protein
VFVPEAVPVVVPEVVPTTNKRGRQEHDSTDGNKRSKVDGAATDKMQED